MNSSTMEEEFQTLEMNQGWDKHFAMIFRKSRTHSSEVGDSATNQPLNRYINVKTYDRSRIKLERTQDSDYINANLVTVPKASRQYILTQGPLPETLSHFWLMVWEQKSRVIVMLNRLFEMENYPKCEQYWPESVDCCLEYDDVKLSIKLESVKKMKHFIIRTMLVKDLLTDKSRNVTQFHYTAWPDHGEPESPISFLRLLSAVRNSGGLDDINEPAVVHCSAGIGRSGTFCLIESMLNLVEITRSCEGLNIVDTLIEMRDCRMGLIQSPEQLRFAYMVILHGIKIFEKFREVQACAAPSKDTDLLNDKQAQPKKMNDMIQSQSNGKSKRKRRKRKKKRTNPNISGLQNSNNGCRLVDMLEDVDSDDADSMLRELMEPLLEGDKVAKNCDMMSCSDTRNQNDSRITLLLKKPIKKGTKRSRAL